MIVIPSTWLFFFQIWCAAGVNLEGGKTKDGGSVVGASVFYSNPPAEDSNKREATKDDVEKLNQELKVSTAKHVLMLSVCTYF